MEDELVAWGKVITLETVGRHSGQPRRVTIGFSEDPKGALLVAAADPSTHWAQNLLREPDCWLERAGTRRRYRAVPLAGSDRNTAVMALILKYGTPSERLGRGPAFRLEPVTDAD